MALEGWKNILSSAALSWQIVSVFSFLSANFFLKKNHLHYVMKQTKFFFSKVFRNEEMAQQNFLANPKVEQYFLPSFS